VYIQSHNYNFIGRVSLVVRLGYSFFAPYDVLNPLLV